MTTQPPQHDNTKRPNRRNKAKQTQGAVRLDSTLCFFISLFRQYNLRIRRHRGTT